MISRHSEHQELKKLMSRHSEHGAPEVFPKCFIFRKDTNIVDMRSSVLCRRIVKEICICFSLLFQREHELCLPIVVCFQISSCCMRVEIYILANVVG